MDRDVRQKDFATVSSCTSLVTANTRVCVCGSCLHGVADAGITGTDTRQAADGREQIRCHGGALGHQYSITPESEASE
ncbi:hypothetical protein NDU88_001416 [Pleurodeles waltl]|uniref:Uncharacterized protein n=1 Tax=Pleurodeles waltl TaxID=8319 RepID=A0AAV7M327_PLEWA|nr:hypothetical protein NDU88_001416 [Pleurodeles waltl]